MAAIQFIAKRQRAWQIIVFNDGLREVRDFLQENISENHLDENNMPYLKKIIYLYSEQDLNYRELHYRILNKRKKLLKKKNEGKKQSLLLQVEE